jgi:iron(III) transport system permease protein
MMECLNDLGAVQYLGVSTLTVSIYVTWLQRSSLAGAAQIALVALLVVMVLLATERAALGRSQFHHTTGRYRSIPFSDLEGWRGMLAATACACRCCWPPRVRRAASQGLAHLGRLRGGLLARHAQPGNRDGGRRRLVLTGLGLAYARRLAPVLVRTVARPLASATPCPAPCWSACWSARRVDNHADAFLRARPRCVERLPLSGSLLVVVLAYSIRVLAVSLGALEAGFERLSPNLDAVARTLGETAFSALRRVHMPLLLPALGAAALLVFVDGMKELPATLLLRPFNFETLATHVYSYAALEQFEQAALGALTIVLIGLVPVLLLHQAVAGGRAGSR